VVVFDVVHIASAPPPPRVVVLLQDVVDVV